MPGIVWNSRGFGDVRKSFGGRYAHRRAGWKSRVHGRARRWLVAIRRRFLSGRRRDVLCRNLCATPAHDGCVSGCAEALESAGTGIAKEVVREGWGLHQTTEYAARKESSSNAHRELRELLLFQFSDRFSLRQPLLLQPA